jgi:hypothetical protein
VGLIVSVAIVVAIHYGTDQNLTHTETSPATENSVNLSTSVEPPSTTAPIQITD